MRNYSMNFLEFNTTATFVTLTIDCSFHFNEKCSQISFNCSLTKLYLGTLKKRLL